MLNQQIKIITLQDVLHYLSRYVKYWRLSLLLALLGLTMALAYFVYGKPSYYSKSIVEYTYVDLPLKSEISDVTGNTKWDRISSVVVSGLGANWLHERVAMRLGLVKNVSEFSSIWHRFLSKVRVNPTVSGHLQIEVWVFQPNLAEVWPQAMLLEYHDYLTESRIKHRETLLKGFTKEMDRIQENIKAEAERDRTFESQNRILENYISNNKLEQLPSQMLTYRTQLDAMEEMSDFIEKSAPTSAEKLALLKKYRSTPLPVGTIVRRGESADPFVSVKSSPMVVTGATGEAKDTPTTPMVVDGNSSNSPIIITPERSHQSEGWEAIEENLQKAKGEYQRLSSTLLPGHEKMRDLKKEIDALTFSLDSEWAKSKASFELEKSHLRERLNSLQESMPEYRKLIASYDDYRRDFRLKSSGRLAWEQAYVSMKGRLTAMEYTGPEVQVEFDFKGFTELRDDVPVSPNKQKLLNYALALALGLGIGGPILHERLKFTSSFVNESEKYFQYPPCGVVPLLKNYELKKDALIEPHKEHNVAHTHAKESFRLIRSTLPFTAPQGNRMQVIMVTSARPNDGKSTIALHLAKSFANSGENVLLVDADLRRGSLHRVFSAPRSTKAGLSDLLLRMVEPADVLQKTPIDKLTFLSKGCSVNIDCDLLASERLRGVLDPLREKFERIVVDSPPILGISDALQITQSVDGALFVIRANQTTQRDIVSASEALRQTGMAVYGFILNSVDFSKIENNYYYGSYYSKYYEPTYYSKSVLDIDVDGEIDQHKREG